MGIDLLEFIPFKRSFKVLANDSLLKSHSQIVITFQSNWQSKSKFFKSRLQLAAILSDQKCAFVAGFFANLQFGCPCQKQPCINMTHLCFFSTRSGLPGNFVLCS